MVDGLDADFFRRPSERPQLAVVLLGGSEGGRSWSYCPEFIHELVDQGYCVLSLPYFGTDQLPPHLRSIPLEYFSKALHWLSAQEGVVIPDHFALVGLSRGAELALLVASRHPEVKAVVAIAPSSVVYPGPPTGKWDALSGQHSAWSESGKELPFVPMAYSVTTLRGLMSGKQTRMFEIALQNTRRVEKAAIPVESIRGPILLTSYTRDEIWPSTLMSEQIVQRLKDRNFPFYYGHARYDAGHADWSIDACRTNILGFLREHFLLPAKPRSTHGSDEKAMVEPGGAANGSRPIRSETNRTSSAAGSGG